jgi:lysophospholipase L1-like esterase
MDVQWRVAILAVVVPLVICFAAPAPGRAALSKDDLLLEGMEITLQTNGQTVAIDPLPVLHDEFEGTLTLGQPGWRGDFLLPKTAWVFRALRPGSLTITLAARRTVKLVEGRDYLLDPNWGSVNAAPGGHYPPGTELHFAYDYTPSRLDLVEQTPTGRLKVVPGQADMGEPLLPKPSPGSTPLFSVYLAHNTTALTPESIRIIDPAYDGVPPVSNAEALARVRAKLSGDEPVTIVFFGDSITAQGPEDFRDRRGSFVDRFVAYLRGHYRGRVVVMTPMETPVEARSGQIVVVKAGVGGNDTRDGLARIARDVLPHRPDLVVIMFGANDENRSGDGNNVPVAEYRKNLAAMVARVRGAGGAPLLMTTSMKNPDWVGTAGNLGEYAAAVRALAQEQQICLVDSYAAWEDLSRRGYPAMVYLGSCINHPVDLGHQLFFEGLRAAFEGR